jgi:putative flippase GtrA
MNVSSLVKKIDSEQNKELVRFLFAGGSAVATDLLAYILLERLVDYNIAKGLSFGLGGLVAYFLNNFWTFKAASITNVNVSRFVVLYLLTFVCNVATNNMIVVLLEAKWMAFFCATGVSTILNYLGQKFWVFKK